MEVLLCFVLTVTVETLNANYFPVQHSKYVKKIHYKCDINTTTPLCAGLQRGDRSSTSGCADRQ